MKRVSLRRSLSLRVGGGKAEKATAERALPSIAPVEGSNSGQARRHRLARETHAASAERQQPPAKDGITIDPGDEDSDGRCEGERIRFTDTPARNFLLLPLLCSCMSSYSVSYDGTRTLGSEDPWVFPR